MKMPADLEPLLQGSENYQTWLAISENRIADALKMILHSQTGKEKVFLGLWRKKVSGPSLDPVRQGAWDLLSGKSAHLIAPAKALKEADGCFPEWIRFCVAVQSNGHYPQQTATLLEVTLIWLRQLVDEVREKSGGYPQTPIAGYVWMNGAIIREWCDPLAQLFDQQGDPTGKANTLQARCSITGSIMAHYPQTLGPDMIAAAIAMEAIGEVAIPKGYYRAIIADYQRIADDIQAAPEEPVTEGDILSLAALRDAYEGLNRLEKTAAFPEQRAFLDTIINRGVTAEPEEEEDE